MSSPHSVTARAATTSADASSISANTVTPPLAKREEDRVVLAGALTDDNSTLLRQAEDSTEALLTPAQAISDPYGWMRDEKRTNEEVLDHLTAENAYTQQMTQHLQPVRETLYDEMVGARQETDYTTPYKRRDLFWYYSRTVKGLSYSKYCRAPIKAEHKETDSQYVKVEWDGDATSPILEGEEVYLDVNELAKDQPYCSVSSMALSPDQMKLAYAVDFSGNEIYSLYLKDLGTGETTQVDPTLEVYGSVRFGKDANTIFYIKMDSAQRPYQVYRRILDSDAGEELLFEQTNELFWTSIGKSSDLKYLIISTSSSETSEVHYIDLTDSTPTAPKCVASARKKVLYDVDHWNGSWIISSNVGGTPNMRLMVAPVGEECAEQWTDLVLNGEALFDGGYEKALDEVETFSKYLVAAGRQGGIPRIWVLPIDTAATSKEFGVTDCTQLTFAETANDVGVGYNLNYEVDRLMVQYNSMVTPLQSLEIDMREPNDTSSRSVLKQKVVPGYDPSLYSSDRITVTARDGTEIPVSMVYQTKVMEDFSGNLESVPVHLYGYGSYGACCEADFSSTRLPLMKRGIVYVCAHVRGGGEMGRQWYEEPNGAKYLCKKNTFNDFVDVAKWLIEEKKLTTPKQLSIEGRSAGGLLVGASINQAPELFAVAILGVPFVDVLCTMVDSSIPLTCGEWEEWGNPNEEKFFEYMKEYSPTNNVKKGGKYPSCLLTGGLHDPRVQYWEPSKFAAEIRHKHDTESSGPVCLKMDMTAGHFSASDRYKYLKELAFDYAFLLDQLGLSGVKK